MTKKITFRGMESSPTMEANVNEQLKRIEKFLEHERPPIRINIVLEAHHVHAHHKVEIHITAPEYEIFIHKEGPDMYKLINEICDKAYHELGEQKRKWVDRHKQGCKEQCVPSQEDLQKESDKKIVEEEFEEEE